MMKGILWLSVVMLPYGVVSADPAWWAERGAVNSNPPLENALANQGQLKHFTEKAILELNQRVPGGAGEELNHALDEWFRDKETHTSPSEHKSPTDYQLVRVGQLKWVAALLYSRLVEIKLYDSAPSWIATGTSGNNEFANVGQLKTVFNFDLSAPSNQLPAWWQKYYYNGQTGIDPNGDSDGDGITNYQEYLAGTHPFYSDEDEDGRMDSTEKAAGLKIGVKDNPKLSLKVTVE